jgi:hypothetical protein
MYFRLFTMDESKFKKEHCEAFYTKLFAKQYLKMKKFGFVLGKVLQNFKKN